MINEIKSLPLFCDLETSVLEVLLQKNGITKQSYNKGATIHECHSICTSMDVVFSGKLVAYSLSQNGSETVVFEFGPGSIIGANLLFSDNNQYPMSIYCITHSVLYRLSKDSTHELLKNHHFVMPFVRSLSLNSQGMNHKIAMYTQKSLRENLRNYLSALSIEQNSKSVLLPISKKQLADYLGVQRPSLFRELKRLKKEGFIEILNKKIIMK